MLESSRSIYYYESAVRIDASKLKNEIKKKSQKSDFQVSQLRIGRIMKKFGLVSKYTVAQFKPHKQKCNEGPVKNELNR